MTTLSEVTTPYLSGLTHIDALAKFAGWNFLTPNQTTISYTFSITSGTEWVERGTAVSNLAAFNATQTSAARAILAHVTAVTGVKFVETTDGAAANFHFANSNVTNPYSGICRYYYGYSYDGSGTISSYSADAYIYLDNVEYAANNLTPTAGQNGYETLLHEVGHALGLKHPFEGTPRLPSGEDSTAYSVMSYTHSGGPYSAFRPYDIAALNWIYGGDGLKGIRGAGTTGKYLMGTSVANTLTGGTGSDLLNGLAGADTMSGGNGSDSYFVDNAGDRVTETNAVASSGGIDLVNCSLANYTLGPNVENLRILSTGGANATGNGLNNTLYAGAGNNVLNGGSGTDTVSYLYASARVAVTLNLTTAQNTSGSGLDTLLSIENLTGSNFSDTLTGNALANTLGGGLGADILSGGGGIDLLLGGGGKDSMTGGSGADRFDFNAVNETGLTSAAWDVITDFKHAELDKIDLSTIDANVLVAGNQGFSFIGTAAFSGVNAAGQLRFVAGATPVLYGSTDADNAAEFAIQLSGVASLTASDFVV